MATSHEIEIGGQQGWFHDDNFPNGNFHTFDQWKAEGYSDRKIQIFLPKDYPATATEDALFSASRYPVIFTNDGQDVFFPLDNCLNFASILGNVCEESRREYPDITVIQPIVVAVFATENRDDEYTHEQVDEGVGGKLAEYCSYICDVVKPWVDENYLTMLNKDSTCIFGTSHGGLAAFYIATRRPDLFGNCICMSASFWVGMDSNFRDPMKGFDHIREGALITEVASTLLALNVRPRIYIDWGLQRGGCLENQLTEAFVEKRSKEIADILRNEFLFTEFTVGGTPISEFMAVEDHLGGHDFAAWRWRLHGALKWLLTGKNIPVV